MEKKSNFINGCKSRTRFTDQMIEVLHYEDYFSVHWRMYDLILLVV